MPTFGTNYSIKIVPELFNMRKSSTQPLQYDLIKRLKEKECPRINALHEGLHIIKRMIYTVRELLSNMHQSLPIRRVNFRYATQILLCSLNVGYSVLAVLYKARSVDIIRSLEN